MTVIEMRQKRAQLWNAAKAFLDQHRTANGTLSAEDTATYEKMETDLDNLGKEIDREERLNQIGANLSTPTADPITNTPGIGNANKPVTARKEYNDAFWGRARGHRDVSNILTEAPTRTAAILSPTSLTASSSASWTTRTSCVPLCARFPSALTRSSFPGRTAA